MMIVVFVQAVYLAMFTIAIKIVTMSVLVQLSLMIVIFVQVDLLG